jgi:hypothetical protein
MGLEELFKQFDWSKLAFIALFALPGFISLQVWSLIVPTSERALKDVVPEAIAFGVLNAVVGAPLVLAIAPESAWYLYALLVFTLIMLPAFWPFVMKWGLRWLSASDVILKQARNGWDEAFLRREPLFIIVHLKDGRRIGGYYGYQSFAGVYPASGHLYLEVLWSLDEAGKFVAPVPDSRGIVLRPDDYHFVELLRVPEEPNDERR